MGAAGYRDHIVVCGWNTTARDLIEELKGDEFTTKVVVLHDSRAQPRRRRRVFRARRHHEHRRPRANRDPRGERRHRLPGDRSNEADMRSILAVMAIESIAPGVRTVVEANNPAHVDHFRRADADEILVTSRLASRLLARSALYPGLSELVTDIGPAAMARSCTGSRCRTPRRPVDRRALGQDARRAPRDAAGGDPRRPIHDEPVRRFPPRARGRRRRGCRVPRRAASARAPAGVGTYGSGARGRTAVVGGATSGLGRASADALAAEGCELLIWSRDGDAWQRRPTRCASARRARSRTSPPTRPSRAAATVARPHWPSGRSTSWCSMPAGRRRSTRPRPTPRAGGAPSSSWRRRRSSWPRDYCPAFASAAGVESSGSCRASCGSRSPSWCIRPPGGRAGRVAEDDGTGRCRRRRDGQRRHARTHRHAADPRARFRAAPNARAEPRKRSARGTSPPSRQAATASPRSSARSSPSWPPSGRRTSRGS